MIALDLRLAVPWAVALIAVAWLIARGLIPTVAAGVEIDEGPAPTVCVAAPATVHTNSQGDTFTQGGGRVVCGGRP